MTVVAIVGVLSAIALPSFRVFLLEQRAISVANALLADVNAARAQSLLRSGDSSVAPSPTWSTGWQAQFTDASSLPAQSTTIDSHVNNSDEHVVAASGLGNSDPVKFNSLGGLASATGNISLVICVGSGNLRRARSVQIAPSGHAEVRQDNGSACNE